MLITVLNRRFNLKTVRYFRTTLYNIVHNQTLILVLYIRAYPKTAPVKVRILTFYRNASALLCFGKVQYCTRIPAEILTCNAFFL